MMKVSFLSEEELKEMNFKSIGKNVKISRKASLYWPETMTIKDNVRIDDFCVLSGNINLGSYVHIAVHVTLIGGYGIYMEDFTAVSSYSALFTASDDYGGGYLTNPTVPEKYRSVKGGPIILKKHVILGLHCVVLPNVTINEGTAVGAMSLVTKNLDAWKIYTGIPARIVKERKRDLLELEAKLKDDIAHGLE